MNSDGLKLCPFCGGKPTFVRNPEDISEIDGIYCLACKAYVKWSIQVMASDTFGQTMNAWLDKWNRRANDAKREPGEAGR